MLAPFRLKGKKHPKSANVWFQIIFIIYMWTDINFLPGATLKQIKLGKLTAQTLTTNPTLKKFLRDTVTGDKIVSAKDSS